MFAVGLDQLWVASRAHQRQRPRWTGVTAVSVGLLVGSNALVLQDHASPHVEALLFVRFVAASVLLLCTIFLASTLANRPAPRPIVTVFAAGVVLRLTLWPSTDPI